jgi:hypothetical protein
MNRDKNTLENKKLTCEVCGNTYDKSFECAIHALAPTCAHCACRIIGHGMEADGVFYCCAHCASQHGIHELEDRVEERHPA